MVIHGHYCGYRLSNLIKFSFYKNIVFSTILFLFQIFCVFSLQICYNDWFGTFFNLVFTALPPLILAILDKEVPDFALDATPRLYKDTQHCSELSLKIVGAWAAAGIIHGAGVFNLTFF